MPRLKKEYDNKSNFWRHCLRPKKLRLTREGYSSQCSATLLLFETPCSCIERSFMLMQTPYSCIERSLFWCGSEDGFVRGQMWYSTVSYDTVQKYVWVVRQHNGPVAWQPDPIQYCTLPSLKNDWRIIHGIDCFCASTWQSNYWFVCKLSERHHGSNEKWIGHLLFLDAGVMQLQTACGHPPWARHQF